METQRKYLKGAKQDGTFQKLCETHKETFVMFQCAAEPWWVFKASAEAMAKDYHVYLFIADGHDELGTEFVSIEKNVRDAADFLRKKGISRVEAMYGVSMGGASVIRFLATEDIPVEKAIIDAGITPYPYPKFICRLIALKDWITIMLGTCCLSGSVLGRLFQTFMESREWIRLLFIPGVIDIWH